MDYLPHAITSRMDLKHIQLLSKHGPAAYGLYWLMVEQAMQGLSESLAKATLRPPLSLPKATLRALYISWGADVLNDQEIPSLQNAVNTMLEVGLWKETEDKAGIYCPALERRIDEFIAKQNVFREAGKKSHKKAGTSHPKGTHKAPSNHPPASPANGNGNYKGNGKDNQGNNPLTPLQGEVTASEKKPNLKEKADSPGQPAGEGSEKVPARPAVPYDELVALYNQLCPSLVHALPFERLPGTTAQQRRADMAARWKENPELEWWRTLFIRIGQSPLLGGKVPGKDGAPPFKASFDWILRPGNFKKIIEGNFDNRNNGGSHGTNRQYSGQPGNEPRGAFAGLDEQPVD